MSDNARRMKSQACAPGRGVDDENERSALDRGDPEAFRSGQVEVAFEGFFAAPELVGASDQHPQRGIVVGDDGANRLLRDASDWNVTPRDWSEGVTEQARDNARPSQIR